MTEELNEQKAREIISSQHLKRTAVRSVLGGADDEYVLAKGFLSGLKAGEAKKEAEVLEQCRLLGMSGEREAILRAKWEGSERDVAALKAKLDEAVKVIEVAWEAVRFMAFKPSHDARIVIQKFLDSMKKENSNG
jgi:hypothetical protein